jgi:REP element-mobilizing transposase RayT
MGRPVLACHIIFGAYGFWLPNDPRGSQSKYVFAPRLAVFGPPRPLKRDTTLNANDAEQLRIIQAELSLPPVRFGAAQTNSIAGGLGEIVGKLGLVLYAAAIMPDHVHVVAARQEMHAEDIAGHLKRAASRQLRKDGLHPHAAYERRMGVVNPGLQAGRNANTRRLGAAVNPGGHSGRNRLPSPWGGRGWKVFLFDLDEIEHAVEYVNANPVEAGLAPQRWPWLKPPEG